MKDKRTKRKKMERRTKEETNRRIKEEHVYRRTDKRANGSS